MNVHISQQTASLILINCMKQVRDIFSKPSIKVQQPVMEVMRWVDAKILMIPVTVNAIWEEMRETHFFSLWEVICIDRIVFHLASVFFRKCFTDDITEIEIRHVIINRDC